MRTQSPRSFASPSVLMAAALLGLLAAGDGLAATHPNVVVFLVDDFGYECIAANGGTSYRTPHVDRLAATGTRFEHGYSQPLCTPTRVQLMTGLYNVRNYTRFGHLEPSQTTFAHLFRDAGYATCIVGKWQLGGGLDAPGHFGFDEYCLWQLDRRPPRYANPGLEINGKRVDYTDGEYGPDIVNRYALDFIARQKDRPFLLYYPMILTHNPFQPTPDSPRYDPKARGEDVNRDKTHFADMTAYMDKMVGNVVAELEKHGLRQKTLVLFTGDNGTNVSITSEMGDRRVRGGKGSGKDNGIHVPLIASWPGTIPQGSVSQDLVDTTDFLPTICEAAGIAVPARLAIDGRSVLPRLRGGEGRPREWVYCWYAREGGARATFEFVLDRRYKLYRDGKFFDLTRDIEEQQPLDTASLAGDAAAAHERMTAALDRFRGARPAHIVAKAGKPGAGSDP